MRHVQARPTPEKEDSSSESDASAADAENHEDDFEDLQSRTFRSAAGLLLASNLSATEVQSYLCYKALTKEHVAFFKPVLQHTALVAHLVGQ